MAARFKATDLKDMIRVLVREELENSIRSVVNEIFSERYLQQLMNEAVGNRTLSSGLSVRDLNEGVEIEEEPMIPRPKVRPTPRPPQMTRENLREKFRREVFGDERDELFEGVSPINEVEQQEAEGIPLDALPIEDLSSKWKKLSEGLEQKARDSSPMRQTPQAIERELEAKRRALDVPAKVQ
jgi:hypothetical protein